MSEYHFRCPHCSSAIQHRRNLLLHFQRNAGCSYANPDDCIVFENCIAGSSPSSRLQTAPSPVNDAGYDGADDCIVESCSAGYSSPDRPSSLPEAPPSSPVDDRSNCSWPDILNESISGERSDDSFIIGVETDAAYPPEAARLILQQDSDLTDDEEDDEELKDFERRPINLYINSPGGCVYSALALINAIEYSKTPVITHALGMVMSGALYVMASGHIRKAHKYSSFMFHEIIASHPYSSLTWIKNDVKECERLQKTLEGILTSKSKFPQAKIEEVVERSKDFYFDVNVALRYKIIDEII